MGDAGGRLIVRKTADVSCILRQKLAHTSTALRKSVASLTDDNAVLAQRVGAEFIEISARQY